MFVLRNIPVVIEPGTGAVEAEFIRTEHGKEERIIPVQMVRLCFTENMLEDLPFVPDTKHPHVFSTTADTKRLSVLVVYDFLGRIATIYVRDIRGKKFGAWEKNHVAEEHAGKTITQFSVRFCFNSLKSRDAFIGAIEQLVDALLHQQEPSPRALKDALRLLSRSRIAPIALPVAIAKDDTKEIKIS